MMEEAEGGPYIRNPLVKGLISICSNGVPSAN